MLSSSSLMTMMMIVCFDWMDRGQAAVVYFLWRLLLLTSMDKEKETENPYLLHFDDDNIVDVFVYSQILSFACFLKKLVEEKQMVTQTNLYYYLLFHLGIVVASFCIDVPMVFDNLWW